MSLFIFINFLLEEKKKKKNSPLAKYCGLYLPYICPISFQDRKVPIGWRGKYVYSSRTKYGEQLYQRATMRRKDANQLGFVPYDRAENLGLRSSAIVYDHLRSFTTICDRLRPSAIIYDHLWSFTTICDRLRPSVIVYDHLRSFTTICNCPRSAVIVYDCPRSFTTICNCPRSAVIVYDHLRSFTTICDCPRSAVIVYDHPPSFTTICDCPRSAVIVYDHPRSFTIISDCPRSAVIVYDCPRSFTTICDCPRSAVIVYDCPRSFTTICNWPSLLRSRFLGRHRLWLSTMVHDRLRPSAIARDRLWLSTIVSYNIETVLWLPVIETIPLYSKVYSTNSTLHDNSTAFLFACGVVRHNHSEQCSEDFMDTIGQLCCILGQEELRILQ